MVRQSLTIATVLLLTACGAESPNGVGPQQAADDLPSVGRLSMTTLAVSIRALYTPQNATVKPNQQCTYRADATGGVTPYNYHWSWSGLDSATGGSGRFLTAFVGSGSFTLGIKVTDAVGDTALASKSVSVASSGIVCP
ncbi:MAG TPA: hypothetical protein VGQ06_08465 [Gemmatimonadales bacterium]|jgi:hypothetical protein|nr:hypothetical protein [Gemmatimonadales bacterium]